jgi:hypothetical protein
MTADRNGRDPGRDDARSGTPFDRSTRSISTDVVLAVAEAAGTDALSLSPLHRAVDPEALDALFAVGASESTGPTIVFQYEGYEVTVAPGGEIDLSDLSVSGEGAGSTS